MWDTYVSWLFCAPLPLRLLFLYVLFSARLAVLNCPRQPLCSPLPRSSPEQSVDTLRGQLLPQGERIEPVLLHYDRAQLLAATPARLTPDLTRRLRSLEIGVGLPRKRYRRKNKQSKHTDLKVLYLNVRSCRNKATDIHDLIIDHNADIVMLTETWLYAQGDETCIKNMTPAGYCCHSFPRIGSRGGGIAFLIKSNLSPSLSFRPLNYISFECVETKLTLNQISCTCICLYRPPPSKSNKLLNSAFLQEFPELLSEYSDCKSDVSVIGDFNFHFDDCSDPHVIRLKAMFDDFGLCQLVAVPTHRHGHTLDWAVTRSDSSLLCVEEVLDCAGLSDHHLLVCGLSLTRPSPPTRLVTSRNIKAVNPADFQADIKTLAGSVGERHDLDVEGLVDVYDSGLRQILDRHAPSITRRVRDRPSAPWLSADVRTARRRRRRAERRWRKTQLTVHRQMFVTERDTVRSLVQEAKRQFFSDKIAAADSSGKQLFAISHDLMGKSKAKVLPSDVPLSDLPQRFCDFFSDKIEKLRDDLDSRFCDSPVFVKYDGPCFCQFLPVSEKEIHELVMQSPAKSCSLDPIPTSLTKTCLSDLVPLMTTIVNESLSTGVVPSQFKKAIVTPLLKKPGLDTNVLKNYRPVSNLPFISKILEKVVLKQLQKHLSDNNLVEVHQSAYRKDHSTETAVLNVLEGLLVKADERLVSLIALLDLSAAFDTLDHSIMLRRLEITFGIRGTVLDWFSSYLCNRSQSVVIGGTSSALSPLVFGVPQGSVLGPVLFTLYSQPISDVISSHDCLFHKYADDTEMSESAQPEDFSSIQLSIQSCISDVLSWMNSNKLKLNTDKTEVMPIGAPSRLSLVNTNSVLIDGSDIPLQKSVKYLGVRLDQSLSMQEQISSVCRACFLELRRIASIRPYLSQSACAKLVTALISSRLDYCNSALAGLPAEQLGRLQRIQNSAARLVLNKRKREHVTPLLKELHWLPVHFRCQYKISVLAYRHFEGTLPTYLSASLVTYHPSRTLRSSSEKLLKVPKRNLRSFGERSFGFLAPTMWNSLPLKLKNMATLTAFKSNLKTYLFNKAFQ